jgi:hypothetical protein
VRKSRVRESTRHWHVVCCSELLVASRVALARSKNAQCCRGQSNASRRRDQRAYADASSRRATRRMYVKRVGFVVGPVCSDWRVVWRRGGAHKKQASAGWPWPFHRISHEGTVQLWTHEVAMTRQKGGGMRAKRNRHMKEDRGADARQMCGGRWPTSRCWPVAFHCPDA